MKKMTIVERIEKKRENGNLNESSLFLYSCLKICDEILDKEDISHSDIFFYVVSYITNAESFFRHLIKEIIDKDPGQLKFIDKMVEDHLSKKDLMDSIYGIGIKKVSAGEVLSQAVPLSSYDQVIRYFDVFASGKTRHRLREISQVESFKRDYIDERVCFVFEDCIDSIEHLFALRHIFCHENPDHRKYTKKELEQHFFNASGLLDLTRILADQLLGIPEFSCEADKRDFLSQQCDEKAGRLDKIVEEIKRSLKIFEVEFCDERHKNVLSESFEIAQKEWEQFAHTDSESVATQFFGGTAMADLYLSHKAWLIDRRIEDLQKAWKRYLV